MGRVGGTQAPSLTAELFAPDHFKEQGNHGLQLCAHLWPPPKPPTDTVNPAVTKKKKNKKRLLKLVVVAPAFNQSPGEAKQVDLCEFEASLVYKVSSRSQPGLLTETLSQKWKKK